MAFVFAFFLETFHHSSPFSMKPLGWVVIHFMKRRFHVQMSRLNFNIPSRWVTNIPKIGGSHWDNKRKSRRMENEKGLTSWNPFWPIVGCGISRVLVYVRLMKDQYGNQEIHCVRTRSPALSRERLLTSIASLTSLSLSSLSRISCCLLLFVF